MINISRWYLPSFIIWEITTEEKSLYAWNKGLKLNPGIGSVKLLTFIANVFLKSCDVSVLLYAKLQFNICTCFHDNAFSMREILIQVSVYLIEQIDRDSGKGF